MVALISYGWESRGAVLDWRDGGEKRERRGFFLFSVRWLGVGAME